MTSNLPEKITAYLRENLSEFRLRHILSVADFARRLGERDLPGETENLTVAALLHDLTRELKPEEHREIFSRHGVPVPDLPLPVWHSKSGGLLAADLFGTLDEKILQAVSDHTTGRTGMDLFSRIIFAADYLGALQPEAAEDLFNRPVSEICRAKAAGTISWLVSTGEKVTQTTVEFYNELIG